MTLLTERLARGEVIILDGATGTELERRGASMNAKAWSAAVLGTHPDIVRQVHEDYIRAGADIIITNTFSTSRHLLAAAGLEDQFESLNADAVRVARVEAVGSGTEGGGEGIVYLDRAGVTRALHRVDQQGFRLARSVEEAAVHRVPDVRPCERDG